MITHILLTLQNQLRILHWQTDSYAEHKALGKAYEDLDDLIDQLVEVHIGKYGKLKIENGLEIKLQDYAPNRPQDFIHSAELAMKQLRANFEKDGATNLANIVDEILSILDRTSYLLTLS